MNALRYLNWTTALSASAVLLSACGGGSGDGGAINGGASSAPANQITAPTTPLAINLNSMEPIARMIMRDKIAHVALNDMPANYVFPGEYGPTRTLNDGLRAMQMAYTRMLTHLQSATTATALNETVACAQGGTVTYTSPAGAGSFDGMFSNCGMTTTSRINGTMQLTGYKATYANNSSTNLALHARLTAIDSVRTVTIEGDNESITVCQIPSGCDNPADVSGRLGRLAYSDGVDSVVADFHPGFYASTAIGGLVNVATVGPMSWNISPVYDALPSSGSVEYTGANNAKLRITALTASSNPGPHVKIEADADGDGHYEISLSESWDGLLN